MRFLLFVLAFTFPPFPQALSFSFNGSWRQTAHRAFVINNNNKNGPHVVQHPVKLALVRGAQVRAATSSSLLYAANSKASLPSSTSSHDEIDGKKKKKKSRRKKKSDKPPPYWRNPSDPVVVKYKSNDETKNGSSNKATPTVSYLKFKVRGNPLPLRRHRTSRGFMYNPSADAQACFRGIVEEIVKEEGCFTTTNNATTCSYVFDNTTALAMTIAFYTKRPLNHFVATNRSRPLKASAPSAMGSRIRTDVDNLAKFVLDSLNDFIYEDDSQISSLCVTKLLDSGGCRDDNNHPQDNDIDDDDDECLGSTVVGVAVLDKNDKKLSSEVVESSFRLYD